MTTITTVSNEEGLLQKVAQEILQVLNQKSINLNIEKLFEVLSEGKLLSEILQVLLHKSVYLNFKAVLSISIESEKNPEYELDSKQVTQLIKFYNETVKQDDENQVAFQDQDKSNLSENIKQLFERYLNSLRQKGFYDDSKIRNNNTPPASLTTDSKIKLLEKVKKMLEKLDSEIVDYALLPPKGSLASSPSRVNALRR